MLVTRDNIHEGVDGSKGVTPNVNLGEEIPRENSKNDTIDTIDTGKENLGKEGRIISDVGNRSSADKGIGVNDVNHVNPPDIEGVTLESEIIKHSPPEPETEPEGAAG
jgi:hypothetical protein